MDQRNSLIIIRDQNQKGLISHIYIKKGLAFQENTEKSKSKRLGGSKSPFVRRPKL